MLLELERNGAVFCLICRILANVIIVEITSDYL